MNIGFLLNGEPVTLAARPTDTLLDVLRDRLMLKGTKEGCNEGDCGACMVMVTDAKGSRALNACILLMGQIGGKAIRTVEGIGGPGGALHPVQQAMVDHHGSQCGFCTPGFVVSMAVAHLNGARDHDTQLAGNLCRCTGYAPIIRAAQAAAQAPVPGWMTDDAHKLGLGPPSASLVGQKPPYATTTPDILSTGHPAKPDDSLLRQDPPDDPTTTDAFADWYLANPDATLVAGATDVGLWVTKDLRDLPHTAFLNRCPELAQTTVTADTIRFGATVTMTDVLAVLDVHHPSYAAMVRRYGSVQVRNAATIGGNIANGSPIGDNPPALIALGATLHLRRGAVQRDLPLEDFFLDYRQQDRQPGEFVTGVSLPARAPALRVYKLSKRFDQDISAVCGAFNVTVTDGIVTGARIAFGGLAGIPKRACAVETALVGQPWTAATVAAAQAAFVADFAPLSDMRASAAYRLTTAANMLIRYHADLAGQPVDLTGVLP